jgi:hypothetical protein
MHGPLELSQSSSYKSHSEKEVVLHEVTLDPYSRLDTRKHGKRISLYEQLARITEEASWS